MINKISLDEYSNVLLGFDLENISVFNSPEWLRIYNEKLEIFGIFEKGERCIGVFFLVTDTVSRVSMLKTPPYTPHCGIILKNSASNPAKRMSNEKKWLSEIADFFLQRHEKIVFVALPPEIIDMQPFLWKEFKVTPQYTYKMSLECEEAELEKRMSPERRNDIKRAVKEGIEIEKISDMKEVERLISMTFSRKEKDFDSNFVNKILFQFSNEKNSAAFLASYNGIAVAASFFVHNHHTAYYLLGGYDHEKGHSTAGALALFTGIKWCRSKGIKIFDFEGSMLPEIERYFRGFGPDLTPYYLVHKANKAVEIALKFKKPELF